MLQIFLFSFLTSIQIIISGYLFYLLFISKQISYNNIFSFGLLGFILIGFLGLFFNFFVSLNRYFNDAFFIFPLIFFLIFYFNKKILKKAVFFSLIISFFLTLTVAFDNHYTPDAGSYHLPYISLLNENKIIIGGSNIHYRFGHISIFQYISALYNNHLFEDNGISIPLGLIYCFFVGYLIMEILNHQNNKILYIFLFIILSFVLFRMNRYSDLGNDGPANIFFFYLIIESLKKNIFIYKLKITSVLSVFIFLNKITLLLAFLVPIYLLIKNFKINSLINRTNIFSLIFLTLFLVKNFLLTGCLAFPIEQSCFQKVFWFNDNNKYAAKYVRMENEAWTKGWPDQIELKKNHSDYISDLGWIKTWKKNHGIVIIKKLSPFLIFLTIVFVTFYLFNRKSFYFNNEEKDKDSPISLMLITICFIGSLMWFFKFPVFRYGYSYFISFFGLTTSFILNFFLISFDLQKFKKNIIIIFLVLISAVFLKNLIRIIPNYQNSLHAWPQIYSNDFKYTKNSYKPVYKNSKLFFFKNETKTCFYSKSPCTHLFNFDLDDLNLKEIYGYKIYYFN